MADQAALRTSPKANEIFRALYGTNVCARLMIDAFKPIGIHFKYSFAAIIVSENGDEYMFPLPVNYRPHAWEPPKENQLTPPEGIAELAQAIHRGKRDDSISIVDHCHRQTDGSDWMLVFLCAMTAPSTTKSPKRGIANIKIAMANNGHTRSCVFRDRVTSDLQIGNTIEYHDLIAVYAGYFDQMLRDLSFVPMKLIHAEWMRVLQSGGDAVGHDSSELGLPWGEGVAEEIPTITLSLDLRKSTFAMQQAHNRAEYALWLEALSELARALTLQNGGIFDKFTGDGIICHFAYSPAGTKRRPSTAEGDAIRASLTCAAELIRALNAHIRHVTPDLKFQSDAFGPAVGLARDTAAWSLDRDGKPVVVGTGIVNACRLNGGNAGHILLTNDMKFEFDQLIPGHRFEKHSLGETHKEFTVGQAASCWQITSASVRIGRSTGELAKVTDRIWQEVCDSRGRG